MATIKQFEDLEIWQKARILYQKVIALTNRSSIGKDYRFRSQLKAAAGSVMDNIAEGFERDSRLEFINFLSIAKGSCGEVRSQSYRALDEGYISLEEQSELMNDCKTLGTDIANFIRYLNHSSIKGQKFTGRN
ncbi:MAG: four helix bundle protein [Chitinophagaceae bacterium]